MESCSLNGIQMGEKVLFKKSGAEILGRLDNKVQVINPIENFNINQYIPVIKF